MFGEKTGRSLAPRVVSIRHRRPAWLWPGITLVDTSAWVIRAWFADAQHTHDPQGQPVGAVHGFWQQLIPWLQAGRHSRFFFALDQNQGCGLRQRSQPHYKAQRPRAPQSLRREFALCTQLLDALGLPHQGCTDYEADDLLNTAAQAADEPFVVITRDKDLVQLIRPGDHWWDPTLRPPEHGNALHKRFKVAPTQMSEALALAGDAGDGICGLPGIGLATAGRLLRHFGSLDALLEASLSDIQALKLRNSAQWARSISAQKAHILRNYQLTRLYLPEPVAAPERLSIDPQKIRTLAAQIGLPDALCQATLALQDG